MQLAFTSAGSLLSSASTSPVDTAGGPQFLHGCTGVCAEQLIGTLSSWSGRWICFRAGYSGGFRPLDRMSSTPLSGHWPLGNNVPQVLHHRRQLDLMPFHEFVCFPYRTDVVEAVLDRSILQDDHRALWCSIIPLIYFGTIEWHQDGRGSDQWFPQKYQCGHRFWASRFAQLFEVAQSNDPGPSADFLRWWYLATRRYLVPAGPNHHLPANEIPVEATQRLLAPDPERLAVPDVPDNSRPGWKMMVGTRTTARDW
ncbi:hypothetical protein PIB30_002048 [Stylosanthes scabra]|uniref:Aminotransferase-like plant mobile domain-containing protein n=1 Tax=Stylosanthes scabra TaxID=79078 RepID=A0ABU6Q2U1_9FABA|nr:hypothetical protein [Stylosanthes scabra]